VADIDTSREALLHYGIDQEFPLTVARLRQLLIEQEQEQDIVDLIMAGTGNGSIFVGDEDQKGLQ